MHQTKGFLYGHFDSRGGSMFVVAPTREKADEMYAKQAGWAHHLEREEWQGVVDQDFFREVVLNHVNPLEKGNFDLEGSDDGLVIAAGSHSHWPPTHEEPENENGNNFWDAPQGELEYVEEGAKPVLFKDGWTHPRWDDDAFFFYVVQE